MRAILTRHSGPIHPTASAQAYAAGAAARTRNIHKNNCPHPYATQIWAWWLAGWNDEDMQHARYRKKA